MSRSYSYHQAAAALNVSKIKVGNAISVANALGRVGAGTRRSLSEFDIILLASHFFTAKFSQMHRDYIRETIQRLESPVKEI